MTDCCLGDSKTSFEYIFFLVLQLWTHFLTLDEWAEEEAEAAKKGTWDFVELPYSITAFSGKIACAVDTLMN